MKMKRDLNITSSAFKDGDMIPRKYTADGQDISPPLTINNILSDGESIAVIMDDSDAPGGTFTHWMIWNISVKNNNIPKNISRTKKVGSLQGAKQGINDFGEIGYRGPAPPIGVHNYHFSVYILDRKINLPYDISKEDLKEKIKKYELQNSELIGKYTRE